MMLTCEDRIQANTKDCSDTTPVKDANRIPRAWPILEMIVLSGSLILFNLFPQHIGIFVSLTDLCFIPLLAPEFHVHMPWLNVWWSLALLLAVAKLIHGRWTVELRWAELGLNALGIYVLARLVFGGPIVGLNPRWVHELSSSLVRFDAQAVPFLNVFVKFALGLALGVIAVVTLQKLVRLLTRTRLVWDAERLSWYALGLLLGLVLAGPIALALGDRAFLALGLPAGLIAGACLERRSGPEQE